MTNLLRSLYVKLYRGILLTKICRTLMYLQSNSLRLTTLRKLYPELFNVYRMYGEISEQSTHLRAILIEAELSARVLRLVLIYQLLMRKEATSTSTRATGLKPLKHGIP